MTADAVDTDALRRLADSLAGVDWPGGSCGEQTIQDAADELDRLRALMEQLRVAMRAAGPHYYLVEAAARNAAKAGRHETAERLEYVYGRLFWMDHALGTMQERA